MLNPTYNIAKVAGSLLGHKWDTVARLRKSLSMTLEQRSRIGSLWRGKTLPLEVRMKMSEKARIRIVSKETKEKMSLNNNKSLKFSAYDLETGNLFREFVSIADAAEFFFNDRNCRDKIKYALHKNKPFLNKYILKKSAGVSPQPIELKA
jgi:hypothetical protein